MPRRKGAARAIDVEMLEESFDLVAPQGDELIRTFYENLFETAPSVQPLFTEVDMERQRQALLNMLLVLRESRDLDDIVPDLKELGARHVEYGAKPEHYPIVGEVLIGAMAGSPAMRGSRSTPPHGRRHTRSSRM
jgi:nitric oxide dioxygenase